jgi:hypothetical protein
MHPWWTSLRRSNWTCLRRILRSVKLAPQPTTEGRMLFMLAVYGLAAAAAPWLVGRLAVPAWEGASSRDSWQRRGRPTQRRGAAPPQLPSRAPRWHASCRCNRRRRASGPSCRQAVACAAASAPAPQLTDPRLRSLEALTPRVMVQWFVDATFGGCSLGLGIVDRRLGELGDSISGCSCI